MGLTPKILELWIVGTPLDDAGKLSESALLRIQKADFIIGESRKRTFPLIKQATIPSEKLVFLMDPPRPDEMERMEEALSNLKKTGGSAVLFSDTGMPLLFDPGREVLDCARRLGFTIRCVPAATSWGTACALSSYLPPFSVVGFLPRDTDERKKALLQLKLLPQHLVLMDTPYRFKALLEQCIEVLGGTRNAFLAWEIGKETERLIWGTLKEIKSAAEHAKLEKGEFVLIAHANVK